MDPLVCARCGQRMSIVAFVTDSFAIQRILDHLGLSPSQQEKPPPIRDVLRLASDGSVLFAESGVNRIWRVDLDTGRMTLEASRGTELRTRDLSDATDMVFSRINALASVDADIYFGEFSGGLRRIDGGTHGVSTIVPGYVSGLLFLAPDQVYFSDPKGFVRRCGPQGTLTTVAGGRFGF